MSDDVKRTYSSTLRADQARATRRAIVAAAADLFVARGYGATTVDAIAGAARVSRKTVFTSVGGKLEALKLARDWAIVGDDEPIPMLERPLIKQASQEVDARKILRSYVAVFCGACERSAELTHVVESAAGIDDGVRALAEEGLRQRRFGMGKLAETLDERGALRTELTVETAGDLLWLFNDQELYRRLVRERGWAVERFSEWLYETMVAQVIRPDYRPRNDLGSVRVAE